MAREESPIQPTRWEILQILKRRQRATVDDLAKALGLTLMAVRLHLVVLERDGLVSRRTIRERPGRPALLYSLTERAEDVFPKSYDLLGSLLLDEFSAQVGDAAVTAACQAAAGDLAKPYLERTAGRPLGEKVAEVTRALNDRHCFAEWEDARDTLLIHLYNCPFYRIALGHRQLCSVDQAFITQLLGTSPEQRSSLLERQGRCTFAVPRRLHN